MPFTFPAKNLENGILISGFTTPSYDSKFCSSKKIAKEMKKKFPDYKFSETARYAEDPESQSTFLQSLVDITNKNIEVTEWLFNKDSWDLFSMNFMSVDHVQHWFWKFYDKKHPNHISNSEFSDAILKIYEQIDKYIGSKLPELKKQGYNIIVVSDHGAGPYLKNVQINNLLRKKNLLYLKKTPKVLFKRVLNKLGVTPHNIFRIIIKLGLGKNDSKPSKNKKSLVEKLIYTYQDINWKKTKAYSFGYYGSIYLNQNLENKSEIKQKVTGILKDLKDPENDEKIVDNIWDKNQLYKGKDLESAPDIIYSMKNFSYASSMTFAFASDKIFSPPLTFKSGEHRLNGVFIASGPHIQKRSKKINLKITDLAVGLLEYYGLKLNNLDGKNPTKAIFKKINKEIKQKEMTVVKQLNI